VAPGGLILYDSSVVTEPPAAVPGVRTLGLPWTAIAKELGKPMVKNVVALGALQAATELFPPETILETLRLALKGKADLMALNEEAFARGRQAVTAARGN
jgi:Pyruvate/2-oxoacid:ferredoxin oxidoreductase gamma subunit